MRRIIWSIFGMVVTSACFAQAGGSFVTGDRVNRAPAVTLHCVGAGNLALPCGNSAQPLFVTGGNPLATAGNQATEIITDQSVASALGTPQDQSYTGGAGSTVAILKGVYAALASGIATSPTGGTFVSRSATLTASQSTIVFPANATRRYIAFQAPSSSSIWVNFLGGSASPNGADCVQFVSGTFYESGPFVARGAVSVYSTTATAISAWEG